MLEQLSIHAWIKTNVIRTETGEVLDFHKYQFMFDVYADRSPLICCMKAAQIGFTTYEILKTAHECKNDKIDIIYVLPTADDVKKFSGGKTNKIIAHNPVLQSWTKDKDSIEQKQFGSNTIYYQGSWTERAALMITAKKLIVDEYDRCKPDIVEQYDSRLQSVADPRKAFFSNPSSPDFGIDKLYKLSDQKKWHITHSCGVTFAMEEKCVNYDLLIYQCPSCKGEITDEERRTGHWKATSEGKWSGYWIPLWIAPWMSAKKIAEFKKDKTPEYFSNFVAGLPYIGGGNKVAASTIIKCLTNQVNTQEDRVIIGVDTGLPIHYVLANKQGYFFYGKCSDPLTGKDPYDELEALLKRFPGSIMVADQGGDLIGIRKLQSKYPGRVFLVWYRKDAKTQEIIRWGKEYEYGTVIADRNRLLQLFIDEMMDRRTTFNGTESEWQDYIVHWLNIYRTWEENALGVKEFKWERNGPDHWCFTAGTKITTIYGGVSVENIQVGDKVLTRKGYRNVVSIMNRDTEIISKGHLEGTPDHPVWTEKKGFLALHAISDDDKILVWKNKKLSIEVLRFVDTQIQKIEQKESILFQMEPSDQRVLKGFMKKFILIAMDQYLKVLQFITKIIIHLTMRSVTWRNYHDQFIKVITIKRSSKIWNFARKIKNILIESEKVLKSHLESGEIVQKEKEFSERMVLNQVNYEKSVRKVYNFEVEDTHEYFANEILVSNCHATMYARIGLDKYVESKAKIIGDDMYKGMNEGRIFDNSQNF